MESLEKANDAHRPRYPLLAPLLAGAMAGVSVDVALYPLDTLKTRLQSAQGFQKAGGFHAVYRGLLTVAATSMPTSALFFVSYEGTKALLQPFVAPRHSPFVHMLGASVGEVFACIIRVPTEIAKQRKQTIKGLAKRSSISILIEAYKTEGFFRGVYRGFLSTVARDLPFSFIQMPTWELLKSLVRRHNDGQVTSLQSAICGAMAGGVAAAATTPLDVAKTRVMLAGPSSGPLGPPSGPQRQHVPRERLVPLLVNIYGEAGLKGLFAGLTPRTTAFMIGGFVFFGVYEDIKAMVERRLPR